MRRQGRRCEAMNRVRHSVKAKRKRVEERGSLEKFVDGVRRVMILS